MFARVGLLIVEPLNSLLLSLDEILQLLLVHLVNSFRHNAIIVLPTEPELFGGKTTDSTHADDDVFGKRAGKWQLIVA